MVVTSGPEKLKKSCFCLFTIFLKKYQRWSLQIFSDSEKSIAAVPFALPNVRHNFRLSPDVAKTLIFQLYVFLFFFFNYPFTVDINASTITDYVICLKFDRLILQILHFKSCGHVRRRPGFNSRVPTDFSSFYCVRIYNFILEMIEVSTFRIYFIKNYKIAPF